MKRLDSIPHLQYKPNHRVSAEAEANQIVRDFTRCPRCGAATTPSKSWLGTQSEFWYECTKCNTYINTYIPQDHQSAVHRDKHTFVGNFGGYGSGKTTTDRQEFYKHMFITPHGNTLIGANVSSQYEQTIKRDIEALSKEKAGYEGKIAQKKLIYEKSDAQLKNAIKSSKVSTQYHERIDFFEEIAKMLRTEKALKEMQVRTTLNDCVREIFKKLTTQSELDADKIQFVNDDFSLRTTYLTGGQLAVDVYSYVIGIVKALQECEMDNNENPIIIDAPFAFTGNAQSEHLFKTLPTVSKQTVLLTLDLNKIKKLLQENQLYDFYVIRNDSQERATIERGDINAIKL